MAASTLTLTDDVPANSTYGLVSLKDTEAIYRDAASSLQSPRTLRMAHTVAKEANGVDRHLIQVVRTDDDTDGMPVSGSVHVVIAIPRTGPTTANMLKEWEKLKNFIESDWASLIGGFYGD